MEPGSKKDETPHPFGPIINAPTTTMSPASTKNDVSPTPKTLSNSTLAQAGKSQPLVAPKPSRPTIRLVNKSSPLAQPTGMTKPPTNLTSLINPAMTTTKATPSSLINFAPYPEDVTTSISKVSQLEAELRDVKKGRKHFEEQAKELRRKIALNTDLKKAEEEKIELKEENTKLKEQVALMTAKIEQISSMQVLPGSKLQNQVVPKQQPAKIAKTSEQSNQENIDNTKAQQSLLPKDPPQQPQQPQKAPAEASQLSKDDPKQPQKTPAKAPQLSEDDSEQSQKPPVKAPQPSKHDSEQSQKTPAKAPQPSKHDSEQPQKTSAKTLQLSKDESTQSQKPPAKGPLLSKDDSEQSQKTPAKTPQPSKHDSEQSQKILTKAPQLSKDQSKQPQKTELNSQTAPTKNSSHQPEKPRTKPDLSTASNTSNRTENAELKPQTAPAKNSPHQPENLPTKPDPSTASNTSKQPQKVESNPQTTPGKNSPHQPEKTNTKPDPSTASNTSEQPQRVESNPQTTTGKNLPHQPEKPNTKPDLSTASNTSNQPENPHSNPQLPTVGMSAQTRLTQSNPENQSASNSGHPEQTQLQKLNLDLQKQSTNLSNLYKMCIAAIKATNTEGLFKPTGNLQWFQYIPRSAGEIQALERRIANKQIGQNMILEEQIRFLSRDLASCQETVRTQRDRAIEMRKNLNRANHRVDAVVKENQDLSKENTSRGWRLEEQTRKSAARKKHLEEQNERLESQLLRVRMKDNIKVVTAHENTIRDHESTIKDHESTIELNNSTIMSQRDTIGDLTVAVIDAVALRVEKWDEAESEIAHLNDLIDEKDIVIYLKQDTIDALEVEKAALERRVQGLHKRLNERFNEKLDRMLMQPLDPLPTLKTPVLPVIGMTATPTVVAETIPTTSSEVSPITQVLSIATPLTVLNLKPIAARKPNRRAPRISKVQTVNSATQTADLAQPKPLQEDPQAPSHSTFQDWSCTIILVSLSLFLVQFLEKLPFVAQTWSSFDSANSVKRLSKNTKLTFLLIFLVLSRLTLRLTLDPVSFEQPATSKIFQPIKLENSCHISERPAAIATMTMTSICEADYGNYSSTYPVFSLEFSHPTGDPSIVIGEDEFYSVPSAWSQYTNWL